MEQRRLRLGDTLDDYCPRERRVTNHAIVAMIEEDIKQTRCTTCDAEHAYKGARVPRRRKKETPAALFKEVLAGMPDTDATPVLTVPVAVAANADSHDAPDAAAESADTNPETDASPIAADSPQANGPRDEPAAAQPSARTGDEPVADAPIAATENDHDTPAQPEPSGAEDWPMHRRLIRAQLPRIEGQKEERRPPDFTVRQPGGRSNFRGADPRARFRGPGGGHGAGSGAGNGNGNRGHAGQRFAGGGRPSGPGRGPSGPGRGPAGRGGGPSAGFRGGPPRQGGGKKRSR